MRGARVALLQGRDAEAAQALVDVIDLEPRSSWTAAARIELAGLLLDQGEWSPAGDLLQEVVDGAGEDDAGRALAALARSRLALVHRSRAATGLRRAALAERPRGERGAGAADRGRRA